MTARPQPTRSLDSTGGATSVLVLAMITIQLGASIAKELLPTVGPGGATALRTLIAATLLWAVWKPWRAPRTATWLRAVVVYGACLGAMNLSFYGALARIPLGLAVALEFIGPLGVALFASRRAVDFAWTLAAAAGILLIVPLRTGSGVDPVGIGFALGAGLFWALYIVFGQRASNAGPSGPTAATGMAVAALVAAPFGARAVVAHAGEGAVWLRAFAVAVCSSALPYYLEMLALKRLPARTFGVLMSLEPAVAAVFGFALLHERLSPSQWTAIALIIVAAAGSALTTRARPVPVGS